MADSLDRYWQFHPLLKRRFFQFLSSFGAFFAHYQTVLCDLEKERTWSQTIIRLITKKYTAGIFLRVARELICENC